MKDGFVFKRSWVKVLRAYPSEIRHEVFDALTEYIADGSVIEMCQLSRMAFDMIIADIESECDDKATSSVKKERISMVRREAANKRWHSEHMQNDAKNANDANCIFASECMQNDAKPMQTNSVNENVNANDANLHFCIPNEDFALPKENGEKEKEEKESFTKEKDKEENPFKENPPLKRESSEREKHPSQPSSELQETEPEKGNKTPSPNPSSFDFRRQLLKECLAEKHTENVKQVIDDWMLVRKRKNAVNSQTAFVRVMSQIRKAKEKYGLSCEECIRIAAERSWTGFESEWLNESRAYGFAKKQTETKIESVNDLWK